jgi:signal transduction histidine kinase
MRVLAALWPSSYRGRIAVTIAAAIIVVTVGIQFPVRALVNAEGRSSVAATLRDQARQIAETIEVTPDPEKGNRASDAARFLPDTRIVVTWPGPGGLYFRPVAADDLDVSATATSGGVTVRLERASSPGGLSDWLAALLVLGGLAVTAVLVWLLAAAVGRRLQGQAGNLAASAEAVGAGDLTVRADETDDELGRAARAFNRMSARLEEADERQRQFLADVAHELRTPVTAIDGLAEALADGTARTDADRTEALELIREESARLRTLVSDLRELTTLDLNAPNAIRPVDLVALATESVARFRTDAARAGVSLVAPEGTLPTMTDAAHVEVILANLIANALHATRRGGSVRVSVTDTETGPCIAVSDTGVGIAAEHLPRIFDRLYRVERSRFREGGRGTGLGLAIVKSLVERLGATIDVASTVGAGSTFTVTLPRPAVAGPDDAAADDTTPTETRTPDA